MMKSKKKDKNSRPSLAEASEDRSKKADAETKTAEDLAQERLEGWKRALADYENLKREVERSRQEFARFANRRLVESLLPTLDNFHAATEHTPDLSGCPPEVQPSVQAWITGVEHVKKQLMSTFEQEGLEEIRAAGMFDPTIHETVNEEVSNEPVGTILKVLLPGYRWHGIVIRPARVIVSKKAEEVSSQ
ncbi:MAG: nucleotide exchange factor GrpE [Patescibacteria group bacterium]